MTVFLNKNGFIPALEQMADPLVTFIEQLSIDTVQLPHTDGEIAVGGLNEQMIMVGHETVGVTNPVVFFVDVLEGIEEIDTILVVFEDGLLFIPTGGHVVNGARVFYAKRSSHGANIS